MRYAPGKVPARPLPAAPSRPSVKPTVTGAPAQVPVGKPAPTKPHPLGGMIGRMAANSAAAKAPAPVPAPVPTKPHPLGGMIGRMAAAKAKPMKSGGSVSSASKRADGCAVKGKTKGKMV